MIKNEPKINSLIASMCFKGMKLLKDVEERMKKVKRRMFFEHEKIAKYQ